MSEPAAVARKLEPVIPGVWRWHVADARIGGAQSDAYAIVVRDRVVLIDPLPIAQAALEALGTVEAIVLTIPSHQRSAWRLRRALGVPVWAPAGATDLEEAPDHSYSGGDLLPGGLTAFHAPGPCEASYVLWTATPLPIAFLGDLATHDGAGHLAYPPAEYMDAPDRAPASMDRLARDVPVQVACFGHGPPLTHDVRRSFEALAHERPQ